jgi:hypothetical protein
MLSWSPMMFNTNTLQKMTHQAFINMGSTNILNVQIFPLTTSQLTQMNVTFPPYPILPNTSTRELTLNTFASSQIAQLTIPQVKFTLTPDVIINIRLLYLYAIARERGLRIIKCMSGAACSTFLNTYSNNITNFEYYRPNQIQYNFNNINDVFNELVSNPLQLADMNLSDLNVDVIKRLKFDYFTSKTLSSFSQTQLDAISIEQYKAISTSALSGYDKIDASGNHKYINDITFTQLKIKAIHAFNPTQLRNYLSSTTLNQTQLHKLYMRIMTNEQKKFTNASGNVFIKQSLIHTGIPTYTVNL